MTAETKKPLDKRTNSKPPVKKKAVKSILKIGEPICNFARWTINANRDNVKYIIEISHSLAHAETAHWKWRIYKIGNMRSLASGDCLSFENAKVDSQSKLEDITKQL